MSETRVTVEDVPSTPYRGLEVSWLAPSVLLAVWLIWTALLLMTSSSMRTAGIDFTSVLVFIVGSSVVLYLVFLLVGIILYLVTPVFLFLDARKVARSDASWNPRPALYAVGSLFLFGLVLAHYLYVRHEYVVDREDRTWWWVLLAVAWAISTVCFGLAFAGLLFASSVLNAFAALLYIIGLPVEFLVPLALYKDSLYVRLQCSWHPNPGTHSFLAIPASFLYPLVNPFHLGYYLYKRTESLGLSL